MKIIQIDRSPAHLGRRAPLELGIVRDVKETLRVLAPHMKDKPSSEFLDRHRAKTQHPLPDGVWEEAARHYSEQELGALVLAIGLVNLWNRVNVSTRQVPGADGS